MNVEKDINLIHRFVEYRLIDDLEKSLELTDLEEIGICMLTDDVDMELMQKYITILNFIENETEITTPVSDDTYDRVVEKYKDLGGTGEIGTTDGYVQSSTKVFREHQYPELRGSLNKVHFIHESEVPEKDSRKSLEKYISTVSRELDNKNVKTSHPITIAADFKWDGVSHVFEMVQGCDYPKIDHVLTRYDVERNIGVDVTHIFSQCDLANLFYCALPANINQSRAFGLKVETFMPTKMFQKYVTDMQDGKCNRRSAVTSITNQTVDQFNPSLIKYLSVKPLQISSVDYIEIPNTNDVDEYFGNDNGWVYIGKLNGRHQYVHIYTMELIFKVPSLNHFGNNLNLYHVQESVECVKHLAGDDIPVDGVVFTILNQSIIECLGRSGNKNRFQIAWKFPQGISKTILKDVEFPVGPTAATITPLAIVEPVKINGNTITNATLSNFDKMERLDLNIGDEVIIKYDIIPKLEKDASCAKGTGRKILRPTHCPICNSDLNGGNRCMNPNCDAKLSGKIRNYLKKMKIKSIGKKTIEKFVDLGYLTCIGDLYRLPTHMEEIAAIPGFGAVSFSKILLAIFNRTSVYPHEFLGAIGIPDISLDTMKRVCIAFDLIHMSRAQLLDSIPILTSIRGIGEITAKKIINGIVEKLDEIEDIMVYIDFLEYPNVVSQPSAVVLFTGVRDQEFADFLEDNNIGVAKSYVKALTHLIVPDRVNIETTENAKVAAAKRDNLPILTISEARKIFNYNR